MSSSGHSKENAHLTFSQREGVAPLPAPLKLGELSKEARAYLWAVVYESLEKATQHPDMGGPSWFGRPWDIILKRWHILGLHSPADEFSAQCRYHLQPLKKRFLEGTYIDVFEFLEFVFKSGAAPYGFAGSIENALRKGRAAYTVVDDKVIFPTATPEEGTTVSAAFEALAGSEFSGARTHLIQAGTCINQGDFASSVRESISAVESVSRVLAPGTTTLGPALSALEKNGQVHAALKRAFSALYGFTCEEQGIRHPLLEKDAAAVDQEDAVFMLGACASFVSYLTSKGRRTGVLK
jgi:hypothetical protein